MSDKRKPEMCLACKERVCCVSHLCGPCWRLRAIALAEKLAGTVEYGPEYEVF